MSKSLKSDVIFWSGALLLIIAGAGTSAPGGIWWGKELIGLGLVWIAVMLIRKWRVYGLTVSVVCPVCGERFGNHDSKEKK